MAGGLQVTLFKSSEKIGGAMLTERQQEIVVLMQENNVISYRGIARKLNINDSAVLKHIKSLKQHGVVERLGGTRGYWVVKKCED